MVHWNATRVDKSGTKSPHIPVSSIASLTQWLSRRRSRRRGERLSDAHRDLHGRSNAGRLERPLPAVIGPHDALPQPPSVHEPHCSVHEAVTDWLALPGTHSASFTWACVLSLPSKSHAAMFCAPTAGLRETRHWTPCLLCPSQPLS